MYYFQEIFGNYYINPNIIYTQSGWSLKQIKRINFAASQKKTPIIFNQNGWYYPAWYTGDWRSANAHLLKAHQESKVVIFQSKFCVDAMSELTGFQIDDPLIIYNAVDIALTKPQERNLKRPIIWLSGVFHNNDDHILCPALRAIEILANDLKEDRPLLKIAGYFDKAAQRSDWYPDVKRKINELELRGICSWVGTYQPIFLHDLMSDVSLALHLKSMDPCPNAVLERMALGVGHIYASSGGTPELIGEAGIGINSPKNWNRQTPVDADELACAIKKGLYSAKDLSIAAHARVCKKFSWESYVENHKKIFETVIKKENLKHY